MNTNTVDTENQSPELKITTNAIAPLSKSLKMLIQFSLQLERLRMVPRTFMFHSAECISSLFCSSRPFLTPSSPLPRPFLAPFSRFSHTFLTLFLRFSRAFLVLFSHIPSLSAHSSAFLRTSSFNVHFPLFSRVSHAPIVFCLKYLQGRQKGSRRVDCEIEFP
jgi:hypothetical protein